MVTQAIPDDAPVGTTNLVEHRDPIAVLSAAYEVEHLEDVAAVVEAEESAEEAASIRTAGERFADVAALATASRAATSLDRLVDDGLLTCEQRQAVAADEAMPNLARVLRQAEIAGHDPHRVLTEAVTLAYLNNVRSLAGVLHHRISERVNLEPVGDRYADWIPAVADPAWHQHLADLALAADTRRDILGAETVAETPAWAVEAFGPVPDDPTQRLEWQERASAVAAHRELVGHDDPAVALPGPPKPGQVEAYASWRAAWRALGMPEATRAEAEMSDGQLRVRVRAYEREQTWQPAYVAHELAGTIQAEQRQRHNATIQATAAGAATDPAEKTRLEREAAQATALADALAKQRDQLAEADQTRALWYAHTAETRTAAERARDELARRGVDADQLDDHTTADEWLAAHAETERLEDQHRSVTDEADLADVAEARASDAAVFADRAADAGRAESAPADIRAETTEKPAAADLGSEDWTRVPTADQTANAVTRAQRALREIEQRKQLEERRTADDARIDQLTRWHADDRADEHNNTREVENAPQLQLTTPID
ncbi:hypothetical protein [Actinopolymorpha alba]|uniref:hypothetical protein n=1 Tax=Actinopolymorpha alba TaxID=533267 RepID=UPI000371653B|nr:hypothetical protein [Actinopolymorpha alba]